MPAGRPSTYTTELGESICARVANAESLLSVCSAEEMPDYSTVMRWQKSNAEFRDNLARAREDMADFVSHQLIAIADEQSEDWVNTKFGPVFNKEAAARSRIRIEARLKLMQLLKPKSYGEKLGITDGEGGPLQFVLTRAGKREE